MAEDNPISQKVIRAVLEREGWQVTLANDGQQAYERFLGGQFDLILMDVQMPKVDGLEATQLIRREETRRATSRTPVIALTAHTDKTQHEEYIRNGMDAVLTKPIDPHNLRRELGGLLKESAPLSA